MIEVSDLRVSYGSFEALHGISFRIQPGEFCGYLGPNGAGKTTTVKAITGILRPGSGSVKIGGADMDAAPLEAKRRIGYVPENAAAFSLLTVREYLGLIGDLYEMPPEQVTGRMENLFENFKLAEIANRQIDTLTKGQRQKTVIAAALLHNPEVLILDEPLSGLDAIAGRTVKDLLVGLAGQGRAILFCSHILEVVERLCDRVIVLHKGAIVADAKTDELVQMSRDKTLESVFRELTPGEGDEYAARELLEALGPVTKPAPGTVDRNRPDRASQPAARPAPASGPKRRRRRKRTS